MSSSSPRPFSEIMANERLMPSWYRPFMAYAWQGDCNLTVVKARPLGGQEKGLKDVLEAKDGGVIQPFASNMCCIVFFYKPHCGHNRKDEKDFYDCLLSGGFPAGYKWACRNGYRLMVSN